VIIVGYVAIGLTLGRHGCVWLLCHIHVTLLFCHGPMKDLHYCTQFRAALTAGKWSASHPARTPNGSPLDWPQLLHKLNKHCKGFTDLAEIANQTQGLALLLGANSKDVDQNDRKPQPGSTLTLGNECILPEERIEEAESGYDTLKQLQTVNFNVCSNSSCVFFLTLFPSDAEFCARLSCVRIGSSCPMPLLPRGRPRRSQRIKSHSRLRHDALDHFHSTGPL
jgi:hypothetical protein